MPAGRPKHNSLAPRNLPTYDSKKQAIVPVSELPPTGTKREGPSRPPTEYIAAAYCAILSQKFPSPMLMSKKDTQAAAVRAMDLAEVLHEEDKARYSTLL